MPTLAIDAALALTPYGADGGEPDASYRGSDMPRAAIVQPDQGGCPSGYGTIYKYDGTTECADPMQPDIANVIAAETAPGFVDRATIGVAGTLKSGVDATGGALAALANPFGSWAAGLVWLVVLGGGLYAASRIVGR